MASAASFVFHVPIVLPHSNFCFRVPERNADACADRIRFLAFECQHFCQKSLNTIIHRLFPMWRHTP